MQLEWQTDERGDEIAFGVLRFYRIRSVATDEFVVTIDNFRIGTRRGIQAAKALAQEHNDR